MNVTLILQISIICRVYVLYRMFQSHFLRLQISRNAYVISKRNDLLHRISIHLERSAVS